eukprot:6833677-Pyramimonas_sp.AAC.2
MPLLVSRVLLVSRALLVSRSSLVYPAVISIHAVIATADKGLAYSEAGGGTCRTAAIVRGENFISRITCDPKKEGSQPSDLGHRRQSSRDCRHLGLPSSQSRAANGDKTARGRIHVDT